MGSVNTTYSRLENKEIGLREAADPWVLDMTIPPASWKQSMELREVRAGVKASGVTSCHRGQGTAEITGKAKCRERRALDSQF